MTNATKTGTSQNGNNGRATENFMNSDGTRTIVFGQYIGREFAPSHSKPSRTYKTWRAADKAKAAWLVGA